jgi:hypothetical protein
MSINYQNLVDDALSHLLLTDEVKAKKDWSPLIDLSTKNYDGCDLVCEEAASTGIDDYFLIPDGMKDIPIWPIDVNFAAKFQKKDNEGDDYADGWGFYRVKTMTQEMRKSWRGKIKLSPPKMVLYDFSACYSNGRKMSVQVPCAILGQKIYDARPWSEIGKADMDHLEKTILLSNGIMLKREYLWSVLIGNADHSVRFYTDPRGAREAFSLRDIPDGKTRRAALRNWVSAHSRKNRSSTSDDLAWVRKHLRGNTDFSWKGYDCRIIPSAEAIRENTQK